MDPILAVEVPRYARWISGTRKGSALADFFFRRRTRREPAARRHLGVHAIDASPALAQLNRDAFVLDEALESTARLEEHRGDSDLTDLNLGEENATVG